MPITDLTGYTWKDIHIDNNFSSRYFSLNTKINGVDYSHVYTDNDDVNPQGYMWSITFYNSNPTESNAVTFGYPESYSEQVEIIGGADATNETLIRYLEQYGTLSQPTPSTPQNIKIGTSNVDIKVGTTQIVKAYVGSELVWAKVEPEPTGETWVINESPNVTTGVFDVEYSSNNQDFVRLILASFGAVKINFIDSNTTITTVYNDGIWTNQAYRTITFSTPPTGDLLTWLQANAVKQ